MIESHKFQRRRRMLVGLEIMRATLPQGRPYSCATIAAFCGCSLQAIQSIERKAIEKLRSNAHRCQ